MKEICGLPLRVASNRRDSSLRTNPCTLDKRGAILSAMLALGVIEPTNDMISKNSRWITALHEAGHAFVKSKLGGQVNYLFIKPDGPVYSGGTNAERFDLTTQTGRYKEMMMTLAGEAIVTAMSVPDSCRHGLAGINDFNEARKLTREDCLDKDEFINEEKCDLLQDKAYNEVLDLLVRNKSEIIKIAEMLLECEDGLEMPFTG